MSNLKVGISLVIVLVLNACSFVQPELIRLENVEVTSFSQKKITISISAKVNNPNNYRLSLVNSDLDLIINNQNMGKVKIANNVHLRKKSTNTYTLILENEPEDFSKIGLLALSMFGNSGNINVKVNGYAKGRMLFVGKKFPIQLEERIKL